MLKKLLERIDLQGIKEEVKLQVKFLDSGKILGFFGALMESFNPQAIKAKFAKGLDEDVKFAIRNKLRLLSDIAVWPYNWVRSFFG